MKKGQKEAFPKYEKTAELDGFEIYPEGYMLCIPEDPQKPRVYMPGDQDGFLRPRVKVVKCHPSVKEFKEGDILVVNPRFGNQLANFTLDDNFYVLVPKQWVLGTLKEYRLMESVSSFLKNNKANPN